MQRLKHGFVGRRGVRAELLRRWFGGQRLLVVTGLGGLGKTALCTEVLGRLAEEGARLLALDGRSAGQALDPVAGLWRQVQAAEQGDAWNTALANLQRDGLGGAVLAAAVAALAERVGNLVLYLDDAESLQVPLGAGELGQWRDAELAAFWRGLCALTRPGGPVTVLVSARYASDDLPTTAHLSLPPMRDMDLVRLLRWFPTLGRLPAADIAWLAPRLDGHPRTVEWLDALAGERVEALRPPSGPWTPRSWRTDVLEPVLPDVKVRIDADLLLPQVIAAAGVPAREHLGRCSLLQAPAPWGAVLAVEHAAGTGRRLGALGLLSPYQPPRGDESYWAPHRMVAEAVAAVCNAPPQPAHAALGAFFARAFDERRSIEPAELAEGAVHHLLAAGQADAAWPVAQPMVMALRDAGRDREALVQVQRVLAGEPTSEALGNCLTFRVQLELRAGVQSEDTAHPEKPWLERRQEDLARAEGLVALGGQNFVVHELAKLLRHGCDLGGAARAFERSLAISARVLGTEEHPDVAASMHELALLLHAQGDLGGAKTTLERALAIQIKVYGTEQHPSVATSLHSLAGVLKDQGDLGGATTKLERSLAISAKVFGTEQHPAIAASLYSIASVLKAQGDLGGAKTKLERALAIQLEVYGTEQHPDIAAALHSLVRVLEAQGDLGGAIIQLERLLHVEHGIFRTRDHCSTCITEVHLAQLLATQGHRERAVELLQHALEVFTRQLPPGHPTTQQAQQILAETMELPGQKAEPYVMHALVACGTVSIRPARLQRIAFRVLLYAHAKVLMPLLLRTGEAQGAPGLVVDAPEQLARSGGAPPRLAEDWPGIIEWLGELRRGFGSDALALIARLPRRDDGIDVHALAQQGQEFPEPDDNAWQALFDEAMAVARAPNRDELQAELPLWTHAARSMLQRKDGEDSVSLAHTLVATFPEQRDTLLAAWADVLTDAQRAHL